MDDLSFTASIIGIIGGISATSKAIKTIKSLPKAFDEVQNGLPLVLSILRGVQNSLLDGQEITDNEKIDILAVLQPCHDKAEELKRVFAEVLAECEKDKDAKDWAKLRTAYHAALRGVKALRVEHLMTDVLVGMKKLALSRVFESATQSDIQALEKAIHNLSKVEPSIPDSDFETGGPTNATQNISTGAIGQQNNAQGGTNTFHSAKYINTGTMGTINYGGYIPMADALSKGRPADEASYVESLNFPEIDYREHDICAAVHNTCDWLFYTAEFKEWQTRNNGVLCVKGKPGAGKSTLMKHTLAHCKKIFPDHLIAAYFFNARGSALEKTPSGMLRSIAYQLVKQDDALLEQFLVKFRDKLQFIREDRWEWRPQDLKSFLASAIESGRSKPLLLLVDALDECNVDMQQVVAFLESLSSSATRCGATLRICLSRRHHPSLRIRECIELIVEGSQDHIEDIAIYVQAKLKPRDDKLEADIKRYADGNFMWVVLVISLVNKAFLEVDIERIRDRLKQVPWQLEELFKSLLSIDDKEMAQTMLMLEWVLFSQRPLKLAELFYAVKAGTGAASIDQWGQSIATVDDMRRRIDHLSRGLVEVRGGSAMMVQFIHESVSDFLLRNKRLQTLDHRPGPDSVRASHYRLWALCRSCIEQISTVRTEETYEQLRYRYTFLGYAASCVFEHGERVLGEEPSARGHDNDKIGKWLREENGWFKWWKAFLNATDRDEKNRDLRDNMDAGLLYLLSLRGHRGLVRSILTKKGADVNAQGGNYGNALQAASYRGHQEIVKLLLEKGADVNAQGGYYGNALQAASARGYGYTIKLLLDKGADVDAQGGYYGSALQAAIAKGHDHVVKFLLELVDPKAASVGVPTDSGYASQRQDDGLSAQFVVGQDPDQDLHLKQESSANLVNSYEAETDPDDIRSVESDRESIGSKVPMNRPRAELLAVKHLASFFAQLNVLRPLHTTALVKCDRWRFTRNYRRILKSYYRRLLQEAANDVEKEVTKVLQSRRNRENIAEGIADHVEQTGEEESRSLDKLVERPVEKEYLENWLRETQDMEPPQPFETQQESVANSYDSIDSDDENDSDTDSENAHIPEQDEFPNFNRAKMFLQGGSAFRNLVLDIRVLILPGPLREIFESTPKDSIQISSENDTTWVNWMKAFLEDYTGLEWDWWPLMPRIPDLQIGKKRLQWKLHGKPLYRDTNQEHADALLDVLRMAGDHPSKCYCCVARTQRKAWSAILNSAWRPVSPSPQGERQRNPSARKNPSKAAAAYTPSPMGTSGPSLSASPSATQGVTNSNSANSGSSNNFPQVQENSTIDPSRFVQIPSTRILFGIQGMRRSLEIEQIKISRQINDRTFFSELKRRHKKHRWFLKRWLSPFRFRYCNFVKFQKLNIDRVFSCGEGLPDLDGFAHDYEYLPRPPMAKNPLIDPKLFAICLKACDEDCKWSIFGPLLHDCFQLSPHGNKSRCIPRKKSEFDVQSKQMIEDVAWGIEADYALSFFLLSVYHLIPILSGFCFWVYWLIGHPGDWQNASVPTLTTLALMAVFWIPFGNRYNSHSGISL